MLAVSVLGRWWVYQAQRFPLARHVPLVALTSACVLAFMAHARGGAPEWRWLAPATAVGILAFFQLRVLDEFKDAQADARYRPERPVPRGLVTLAELRVLGLAAAAAQLALVLALRPGALPLLLAAWAFMALMTAEFFAPAWLRARPGVYLLSHQPVVPLLYVLTAAWDWAAPGRSAPPGALLALAGVSFGSGVTLEIGRKVYAPSMEREGVETYTAAWGVPRALLAWLAGAGAACAAAAFSARGAWSGLPPLLWGLAAWAAWSLHRRRGVKEAGMLEYAGAGVVLGCYLTLALGDRP